MERNNAVTDAWGTIFVNTPVMARLKQAVNTIIQGKKTTYAQEDALSVLWHEITHNRHKLNDKGFLNTKIGKLRRYQMELANELVSRNTLPDFFKRLGGKLQNKKLITDRPSTGYNTWVRNYQHLIAVSGADKKKVVGDVQQYLFNNSYQTQAKGVKQAIAKNSDMKFKNKGLADIFFDETVFLDEGEFKTFLRQFKETLR